jgi:uncharacterized protein YhdP
MKRLLRWIAIVVAIIIVLILVLPFVINVNDFRPRLESELTNALGRKVTVGNLSLSLWSGSLAADNITIADDPAISNAPFVKAESLNVGVNMIPLIFSKTLQIRDITLTRLRVSLRTRRQMEFLHHWRHVREVVRLRASLPKAGAPSKSGAKALSPAAAVTNDFRRRHRKRVHLSRAWNRIFPSAL